jgi:hypothetical protein
LRTGSIAVTVVAVPVVAAGLVLSACGGTASTSNVPGAGPSGMPQPGQPGMPQSGQAPQDLGAVVAGVLDGLVDDGTITSAQKSEVVEAFDKGTGHGPPQASLPAPGQEPATKAQAPGPTDLVADVLDPLVEDGTLTSAQADTIGQTLADAMPGPADARAPPADGSEA